MTGMTVLADDLIGKSCDAGVGGQGQDQKLNHKLFNS